MNKTSKIFCLIIHNWVLISLIFLAQIIFVNNVFAIGCTYQSLETAQPIVSNLSQTPDHCDRFCEDRYNIDRDIAIRDCLQHGGSQLECIDNASRENLQVKCLFAQGGITTNNWTCVRKYRDPVEGSNKVGSENRVCKNLFEERPPFPSEERARDFCYKFCQNSSDNNKPYQCLFFTTRTCIDNDYMKVGGGGSKNDFGIGQLSKSVGELNKLGNITPAKLIGRAIGAAMGILGTIAIGILLYGGVLWMTSRGDSGKAETALKLLLWGGLGVVVILTSFAIVNFIFGAFQ